jgi:hypothetical protein
MSVLQCVQCSATTRKGIRCKNTTCIYSEFCGLHTQSLLNLALRQSWIPTANRGLYTTVDIPKHQNIARYTGELKTFAEYDAAPSGYGYGISAGRVMDAASTQTGLGRYVNDCRAADRRQGHCARSNARFVVSHRNGIATIWVRAIVDIPAESEIYASYGGSRYWR